MQGYGLDVEVHRFQSGTAWAVNICGYKTGTVYPDEWLVFGAHFDIAPPVLFTPAARYPLDMARATAPTTTPLVPVWFCLLQAFLLSSMLVEPWSSACGHPKKKGCGVQGPLLMIFLLALR